MVNELETKTGASLEFLETGNLVGGGQEPCLQTPYSSLLYKVLLKDKENIIYLIFLFFVFKKM